MRYISIISALFFSVLSLYAQDYAAMARMERNEWNSLMNDYFYGNHELRKDSIHFFSEANKLLKEAKKVGNKELVWEIDFLKYNFLSSRNYPSYLREMEEFIQRVDQTNFIQLKARSRQAIGLHYFYEKKDFEKAITYLSESYKFIDALELSELPEKQELVYNIAYVYYHTGYYQTAIDYLTIAEQLTNSYYDVLILNIKTTKGSIWMKRGDLNRAEILFQEVKRKAKLQGSLAWETLANIHLAELYYKKERFEDALKLLDDDSIPGASDLNLHTIVRYHLLKGFVYRSLRDFHSLKCQVEILEPLFIENELISRQNVYQQFLWLKSIALAVDNQFDEASKLMDQSLYLAKKLADSNNVELVLQSDQKQRISKNLKEKTDLSHQRMKTIFYLVVGLSMVVFLTLLLVIYFQKQKIKSKQIQNKLVEEKEQINSQLNDVVSQLEEITNSLLQKNEEILSYKLELEELESLKNTDPESQKRIDHLNDLLSKAILTDERWQAFKKAFENVHPGYIAKIKEVLPNVSESEMRYLVLRKVNLSVKEIASLLGIKVDSIRMYRLRIRQKHNLIDESQLEKIVSEL